MKGEKVPYSYKSGKREVLDHFNANGSEDWKVLDVGAGIGTYRDLLSEKFKTRFDAIEIHRPYIDKYELEKKYDNVYETDAVAFDRYHEYDLVIFGDVLEHVSVEDTKKIIEKCASCRELLIAVPYEMKQGAVGGVKSEIHLQDDLTPELFDERYPGFKLIYTMMGRKTKQPRYGYYVRA